MRLFPLATLASLDLFSRVPTVVGQVQSASNNPTLSPIVCEPPQLDALSKEVVKRQRKRLCVQKDILENLRATGAALAKAAHTFESFPEAEGPNAITCRNPPFGFHMPFRGLAWICAFNNYWTELDDASRREAWRNNKMMQQPYYVGAPSFQNGGEVTPRAWP